MLAFIDVLASVREVRVASVMVPALADIAKCYVGTRAVAADTGVVPRRRVSYPWT